MCRLYSKLIIIIIVVKGIFLLTGCAGGSGEPSDKTPPTPGNNGLINTGNVSKTALTLKWEKAVDDLSSQDALEYCIYQSENENIDTLSNAESNGTKLVDWTTDISSYDVLGLADNTDYYYNIVVRDEGGTKAIYSMVSAKTVEDLSLPLDNGILTLHQGTTRKYNIQFGRGITSLDVNGDGYSDFLVGAPNSDQINGNLGAVYVYYGNSSGTFSPEPDRLIEPPVTTGSILFGYSLAVMDFNDDGNPDLLIGAPGDDSGGTDGGAVYLYYGSGSGGIGSSPGLKIADQGDGIANYFGTSLAVGDVDGNGRKDLLVGAGYDDASATNGGAVYLFLNGTTTANYTFTLAGAANNDYLGFGCAIVDINGDGENDVVVGIPYRNIGMTDNGAVYAYYNDGGGTFLNPDTPDYTLAGPWNSAYDYFGYTVTNLDVNNDGKDDLVVGIYSEDVTAVNAGMIVIYSDFDDNPGHTTADVVIEHPDYLTGSVAYTYFGSGIGVGDYNNDGRNDLLAGAIYNNTSGSYAGSAYGFTTEGSWINTTPTTTIDNTLSTQAAESYFGSSVACGDLNDDGVDDLVVGVPYSDALYGNDEGAVMIYWGLSSGTIMPEPDLVIFPLGTEADRLFGWSVHIMDINNDGENDLLVGAPGDNLSGTDKGAVYVYYGTAGAKIDTSLDRIISDPGDASANYFGTAITSGDLNGDSYPDLVISAAYDDDNGTNSGTVYIWRSNTSNGDIDLSSGPSQEINDLNPGANHYFGTSLAVYNVNPDVDSFKDLLVGSIGDDTTGTDAGIVHVVYGDGTDTDMNTGATGSIGDKGDNAYNYFGSAMVVANFNNDSVPDLAIGGERNDDPVTDTGIVYLWYGSASTDITGVFPDLTIRSYSSDYYNYFGSALGAVDINHDGVTDLVIGARGSYDPYYRAGIVYIETDLSRY